LIVDGSIASAQTVVNAGGLLGGHGSLGGSLVNSGIVSPGDSPGTLTVNGNYTQNSGGTLRIQIGGLAPNEHSLLAVNGHASLAGTLQLIQLGSFSLQPGNQITFLTANNGVSGTFSTVQNGIPSTGTIVQLEVTSLPDSVVLEGTQGSFTQVLGSFLTPNEAAVAKMLDSAAGNPLAAPLFQFLNSQPLNDLPHDLSLIAPAQVTSFQATSTAHGNTQIANLGGRMANIRAGSTGFSSVGFTLNGGVASSGDGLAGVSGPEGKSGPSVLAPTPENRWGVFVTGIGEFTNVYSTPNAAGYDIHTGGVTFGADYRVCPFFAIGLSAGYAHTNVNIAGGGGNIDVNSGKFGLYATAFTQGFYVDTAVSGGPSGYNSHRTALQGTASGSTDSGDFNFLVATGYDWKFGGLTIGPTASFQYGYIGMNAFTETGSLAPLKFPDQNFESERTAFGFKTSYDWKIGHVDVLPEFNAAWQHEYGDTEFSIVSSLASGAGNSFTVTGPPIGRDSLLVGAGVAVALTDRITTYIYYDGEFARTNYLSNNVTAGVRVTF
jgi:outer membrane autotransporter protein